MRLALIIAFLSGVTSLGYQVTWTRLLASGTGNTTYVFTVILALFLTGIAIGALLYNVIVGRLRDPVRVLAVRPGPGRACWRSPDSSTSSPTPETLNPGRPMETLGKLIGSAAIVVLPVTIVLGIAFPTASALLRDAAGEAGTESGSLLASNTTGAILGSLVVPFILMPTIGSPAIVVLLAVVNLLVALGLAVVASPRRATTFAATAVAAVLVIGLVARNGIAQPNEAWIESVGGTLFASTEDEIASVQAGQVKSTPELWVAGTSMTLLTVDAKLMPILPLIARPDAERALVVAFGMGTAFRSALTAGLKTDVVELVPSVPEMFHFYYDDADAVLADPNGRVVIADGRNHLELSDERFDIIVTDPPPPIESSGASVISSKEYYEAGRDHLTEGGVMMQWTPYGAPENEFKDHLRTFAAVFPYVMVVKGAGGYGAYLMGSEQPITLDPAAARDVLARPGVLEDISSAYDSPASTIDEWLAVIQRQTWFPDAEALHAYVGEGPLITDDRPRPEYFLMRRLADGRRSLIGSEPGDAPPDVPAAARIEVRYAELVRRASAPMRTSR